MNIGRHLILVIALASLLLPTACREADPTAPSGSTLSISANPPSIALGESSRITVIAVREDGVPVVDGTVINLTTTLGSIPEEIYTNNGVAEGDLYGGQIPGEATVTATAGANGEVSTTVQIGSSSSFLTISASPGSLPYGGGSSAITVIAYDENSVPLSGIPIQFSTDHGSLASGGNLLYTNGSGIARDTLNTDLTANVTASSGGLSPVSVTVTVDPEQTDPPSTPNSITVTANPGQVAPNQASRITATVTDSAGQPISGAGVVFSTTWGSLSSGGGLIYTNSNGQARDTLRTDQTATVTASSGTVSGSVTVTIIDQVASIVLTANPAQITSCTATSVLTATVLDANNQPLAGKRVDFSLDSGSVGALGATTATSDANGQAFSSFYLSSQTECQNCQALGASCSATVRATSEGMADTFTINVNP